MADKSEFWKAYKHPLWQEKRLRIMERADFACERCGDKETTLNVHHAIYYPDRKPWEYEDNLLQCLCEECHLEVGAMLHDARLAFSRLNATQQWPIVKLLVHACEMSIGEWTSFLKKLKEYSLDNGLPDNFWTT